MQCDNVTVERKPDIVIVNEMEKTAIIMDVAIPGIKRIIDNKRKRLKIIRVSEERFRDFGIVRKLLWYFWSSGLLGVLQRTLRNM